jgi:hypothetical protein
MRDAPAFVIKGDTPAFVIGDGMGDVPAFMIKREALRETCISLTCIIRDAQYQCTSPFCLRSRHVSDINLTETHWKEDHILFTLHRGSFAPPWCRHISFFHIGDDCRCARLLSVSLIWVSYVVATSSYTHAYTNIATCFSSTTYTITTMHTHTSFSIHFRWSTIMSILSLSTATLGIAWIAIGGEGTTRIGGIYSIMSSHWKN